MRIGIDARELCGHVTGVGRYLRGLLHEWALDERVRRHEFVLYAPQAPEVGLDRSQFAVRIVPGRSSTWWEQIRLPAAASRDGLDLFFAPAYTAPIRLSVPIVVTIHDVSFLAHPEWFRRREGLRRRILTRRTAAKARAIITVSAFSRLALLNLLRLPPERVHVIAQGVTAPTVTRGGQRGPRVLFVGSIFNRRHVPDLIRAFARVAVRHPGAVLDLVGDDRSHPREDLEQIIHAEALDERVRWHRYVTDEQLDSFYGQASVFAFLSEYEGFGLTPLEALSAGVVPVLLDTPVARESCGQAALYVPPGDIEQTAEALEQALTNEGLRSRVLSYAPEVLAQYRWPAAARKTMDLLERTR